MSAWLAKNSHWPRIALMGLLFSVLLPCAASAFSTVASYGSAFKTICDGDCFNQTDLEARRQAAGFGQPFELGLKLLEDGLDLTIESDGNIFLYGSLNVSGSATLGAGSTTLNAVDIVIRRDVVIRDVAFGFPSIGPGSTAPPLICGCLSTASGSATIRSVRLGQGLVRTGSGVRGASLNLFAEATAIAALVGLDAPLAPRPGIVISRAGDIYLDVSMARIDRLTVSAGKSLFIVGSDSLPVPEPGTGLLFGLGLISLATFQTRHGVSRATQITL